MAVIKLLLSSYYPVILDTCVLFFNLLIFILKSTSFSLLAPPSYLLLTSCPDQLFCNSLLMLTGNSFSYSYLITCYSSLIILFAPLIHCLLFLFTTYSFLFDHIHRILSSALINCLLISNSLIYLFNTLF